MKTVTPLKRHEGLQPISREHHQSLLLCWKIRVGLKKKIALARIYKYVDWFYHEHILPHFTIEETHIFPLLGNGHDLVEQALSDHQNLKNLFEAADRSEGHLRLIEEGLEAHIRFEERELFQAVQSTVDGQHLEALSQTITDRTFCDDWEDRFWEMKMG